MDRGGSLTDENLVYYRNIEFLKEITKQATTLMGRSNSLYRDIIGEPGQKAVGHSVSTENSPSTAENDICHLCNKVHHVDFCMLQEVLNDESLQKLKDENGENRKAVQKRGVVLAEQKRRQIMSEREKNKLQLPIYEELSPKELNDYYDTVCARFGNEAGRRFLEVRSLVASTQSSDKKAGKTSQASPPVAKPEARQFPEKLTDCTSLAELSLKKPAVCHQYPPALMKKYDRLLEIDPPCNVQRPTLKRDWKKMFERSRFLRCHEFDEENLTAMAHVKTTDESEWHEICQCRLRNCICSGGIVCVEPPKEKNRCQLIPNSAVNNYLVTLREGKVAKNSNAGHLYVDTAEPGIKLSVDSRNVENRMRTEQTTSLKKCLEKFLPENCNEEEAEEHVKNVASVFHHVYYPKIDDEKWLQWRMRYKLRKIEDSIPRDSLDGSSIPSCASEPTIMQEDAIINVKEESRLYPTRIPYASDVFRRTNNLFGNIMKKFQKIIINSLTPQERLYVRPKLMQLFQKISLRKYEDPFSHEVEKIFNSSMENRNILVALYAQKWFDAKKGEKHLRQIRRLGKRRQRIQDALLKSKPRAINRLAKYTKKRQYKGFTPFQRKVLRKPEMERFKSCDLVGDERGRAITKKAIHRDYQFLKRLMDVSQKNTNKILIDKELEEKYLKFQRTLRGYSTCSSEVGEVSDSNALRATRKEEATLVQGASEMSNRPAYWSEFLFDLNKKRWQESDSRVAKKPASVELKPKLPSSKEIVSNSKATAATADGKFVSGEMSMLDVLSSHNGKSRAPSYSNKYAFSGVQSRKLSVKSSLRGSEEQKNPNSLVRTSGSKVLKMNQFPQNPALSEGKMKTHIHSILNKSKDRVNADQPQNSRAERLHQSDRKSQGVQSEHDLFTDFDLSVSNFLKTNMARARNRQDGVPKVSTDLFVFASEDGRLSPGYETGKLSVNPPDAQRPPLPAESEIRTLKSEVSSARTSMLSQQVPESRKFSTIGLPRESRTLGSTMLETQNRLDKEQSFQPRFSQIPQPSSQGVYKGVPIASQDLGEIDRRASAYARLESKTLPGAIRDRDQSPSLLISQAPSEESLRPIAHRTASAASAGMRSLKSMGGRKYSEMLNRDDNSIVSSQSKFRRHKGTKNKQLKESSQSLIRKSASGLLLSRSYSQLFPGKKVLFGVDIGQGLRNVKLVKDNARSADENRKDKLLKILTGYKEKPLAKEPSIVKTESLVKSSSSLQEPVEQSYTPKGHKSLKSPTQPIEYPNDAGSASESRQHHIKTLDEIYKEVHGINKHNTPLNLVERSYEFESDRRQQLRLHRQKQK